MKYKFILFVLFPMFGILSCTPDTPDAPETTLPNYIGTYIGNCDTYINGTFHSTVSKTITISSSSTPGHYLMGNNIFMSTTCDISGSSLTIPEAITATTASFSVKEYGSGIFSDNNLTIEFHQDNINASDGSVNNVGKWIGTLVKQ